jgi:hypothetical protein
MFFWRFLKILPPFAVFSRKTNKVFKKSLEMPLGLGVEMSTIKTKLFTKSLEIFSVGRIWTVVKFSPSEKLDIL